MKRGRIYARLAVGVLVAALVFTGCGSPGNREDVRDGSTAQLPDWESIPEGEITAGDGEAAAGVVSGKEREEQGMAGGSDPAADRDNSDNGAGTGDAPDMGNGAGAGNASDGNSGADAGDGADTGDVSEAGSSSGTGSGGSTDNAAGTTEADQEGSSSAALEMTGSAELVSLMKEFMAARGLNASNYAVAYKNLSTGETFYFNELKQWDACSTYKLPLNLLYYDMEAAGEITEDTIIPGTNTPLSECHKQSLQFSNNELSEAMVNNLGAYDAMKRKMRKYFTLTDDEIDNSYYYHNYFCARMMMDCANYLYDHQTEYPDALGYLEAAQPGQYFRTYLTDCVIAQKYGLRDGYNHDAGIIFGKVPFVLSVYTYQAGGNELIARTAELFYSYTEG